MADLIMCDLQECKKKKKCKRFMSTPDKFRQSYFLLDDKEKE